MPPSLDLAPLLDAPVPPGQKGLPVAAAGLPLRAVGQQGWHLFDGGVLFPACVIQRSALAHNRATMGRFAAEAGMRLAPHGKTTMAPQLFDLQFQDGIWGLTAATPAHLMVYRRYGVQRILYANQLVDPVGIAFVLDEMAHDPAFEFICLVDSVAGARQLHDAVAQRPAARPLDVLIEVGVQGARCGVRTEQQAVALIAEVGRMAPHLRLRGVEAFEGVVSTDARGAQQVREQLAVVRVAAETLTSMPSAAGAAPRLIISAGGSAFLQLVASELATWPLDADYILRSGCYITNDHGMYARAQADPALRGAVCLAEGFRPALEVWGQVLSRPEPDRIIVNVGKRDVSHDIELPRALHWVPDGQRVPLPLSGAEVVGLNDQHAWITLPADHANHPIAVGDRVALGCSHPCTTFDKWKYLLVVDDDYQIVDAIATCF